jgi:peptidoglycan lytic transglycosylase G
VTRRPTTRSRPPRQRSPIGPLVFLLLVIALVVFAATEGQAAAGDQLVTLVESHDTLLRQAPLRAIVESRLTSDLDAPADPAGVAREFEVQSGDTAEGVSLRLEDAGVVRSHITLLVALYDSGKEDDLQAGVHPLSPAMTPREVAQALVRSGSQTQVTLRITEGWRLSEIAAAVSQTFPSISKDAFQRAAIVGSHTQPSLAGLDPNTPLEGFLFPDTYFFRPEATADTIIGTLLDTFETKAGAILAAGATDQKRSVYDLVKLASIVEREARDRKESPTIAGVYANRLRIGMKLDADPTIQYAVGSWRPLTLDDLKIDSPFNTYKVAGLPPTPIAAPGLDSLKAAAQPAQHDYFYFVAKNDGSGDHLFAHTLEEQEANRLKVGNL